MPKKVTDLEQPVLEPSGLDPVPPDEAPQPAPAAKTKKTATKKTATKKTAAKPAAKKMAAKKTPAKKTAKAPSFGWLFLKRRSSSCARSSVAKGEWRVPSALSSPVGDTCTSNKKDFGIEGIPSAFLCTPKFIKTPLFQFISANCSIL